MVSLTDADVAQVIQIIQHLYSPTRPLQPQEQQAVQHQLVEAQKSEASWGLIGPLLAHDDINVRFFGAHTAGVKITRDWDTLAKDHRMPLLNSLLDWTVQSAARPGNAFVIRKLFVALSAITLRLSPKHFPTPITTIFNLLRPSQPTLSLPLEFAQILVEEVSRAGLIGSRKFEIQEMLKEELPAAVGPCNEVLRRWAEGATDDEAELAATLKCLESWITWGLSGDLLHEALPLLIALLSREETFVQCSEVLQEVLQNSVLRDGRGSKVLTEPLLVWIARTGKVIGEACFESGDVDEAAHSLCKLLVALGEHSTDHLALWLGMPEAQVYFSLMLGFCGLQGFYGVDEDVSEMPLAFWSLFQESLVASPHVESSSSDAPAMEWTIAKQIYSDLVHRLRRKVVLPTGGGGWMKDQVERFNVYRREIGDAIVPSFYILRSDLLGYLVDSLLADLASPNPIWEEVEATLHCLRCAQEAVELEEATHLPRLFSAEALGRLPSTGDARVRLTTLALIGDFASWFHSHPDHILQAISYIVPALEVPTLCSTAANALKTLCDICRTSLTSHIGSFGNLYVSVQEKIEPEEKAKVLEAITSVVQALPPMEAIEPIKSITDPVVDKLVQALQGSAQLPEEAKVLALQQILSLTAIARGLTPSDDFDFDSEGEEEQHSKGETWQARMDPRLLDVRQRMLNAVASMVELWSSDSEVVDSMSRFFKAMSTATTSPTLISLEADPLLRLVARASERNLNGVWLLLGETLVGRLAPPPGFQISMDGDSQRTQALVREVAQMLITGAAQVLAGGLEAMESHPDIVEGLFKFAGCIAARFPVSLLAPPNDLFNLALHLSTVGLGLQERYSVQSVTNFVTTILARSKAPDELLHASNTLLAPHGLNLLRAIIYGAGGHCPRSVIPHLAELLAALVTRMPVDCAVWLSELLSVEGWPDRKATPAAKEKLKAAVLKSRMTKKVREALNEFAVISRGLDGSAYGGSAII